MSMSGIEVPADVTTLFNDMKLRSTNWYAVFKIENKKKVVISKLSGPKGDRGESGLSEAAAEFDAFKAECCENENINKPSYILFDWAFCNNEGRKIKKISFIFWCPESSNIGDKMIYASTKDTLKKAFTGLSLEFQANDIADMDFYTLKAEVEKKA